MVGGTRVGRGCGQEGGTEEGLGRPVVGRGVEGADAEIEGASDYLGGGDGVDVGVVLGVEGCGAAD